MSSMNDPNAQAGPSGGPATDGQPKITAIFKSSAKSSAGDVVVEAADDSNTMHALPVYQTQYSATSTKAISG